MGNDRKEGVVNYHHTTQQFSDVVNSCLLLSLNSINVSLLLIHGILIFVCYEETKRELKRKLIYECRCHERLKAQAEGSTRLTYTGLRGEETFEKSKGFQGLGFRV